MREIKFRAWWVYDDGEELVPKMLDHDDLMCYSDFTRASKAGDILLMQYTGLNDRHDVEIYECDFVKTVDGIMRIEYLKDSFQCIDKDGKNHRLYDYIYSGCCVVIGNIYENPELNDDFM